MRNWCRRIRLDEQGDSAIEFLIVIPALIALVAFVFIGGRYALTQQAIAAAAGEASRSASIARTPAEAESDAQTTATSMLQAQRLHCQALNVSVDTSGFTAPVGTPANAVATITCQLDLSDITAPGMPGSITITRTSASPIDTYRGRS